MLDKELATIALYPDTLDALRRVREQGVKVAVASNLAQPYAALLKALLSDLVDIWHFSPMQLRLSLRQRFTPA